MNIAQIFQDAVERWPDRNAIIDKDGMVYSYARLHSLVIMEANKYKDRGITAGDRVLVFVPMSIELYVAVLALFYLGASAVFLDEWVSKERMEVCCKLAKCKGFVASFKIRTFALVSKELRIIPYWFGLPNIGNENKKNVLSLYDCAPELTALITFTTGSTGLPKAANRTHAFLYAQFNALRPLTNPLPNHETGPDMPMLPIVLLLNLGRGVTSVIADMKASKPKKFKPKKVAAQIARYGIVSLTTSPYYAEKLSGLEGNNINTVLRLTVGGGAVFPVLVAKIMEKLPQAEIVIVYGSTEAEPVSHIAGNDLLAYHSTVSPSNGLLVGLPDERVEVSILRLSYNVAETIEPLVKNGSIGEICVSGDHVLKSYVDNPTAELQNKIWENGKLWHRTGDAGFIDESGRLFLVGRCKQILTIDGQTYYPFLIEYFLSNLPGVVCGTLLIKNNIPYVVIQTGLYMNALDIERSVKNLLPDCTVIYCNEIPLDPRHNTKIDYERLIDLI